MRARTLLIGSLLLAACGSSPPPLRPPPSSVDPAPMADTPPPELPPEPPPPSDGAVDAARQELGQRYATAHGIKLYSHQLQHLGNHDRVFAPMVATDDGGVVLTGTRVTPRRGKAGISAAVAARVDGAGAVVWEHDFALKGYAESEGGSVVLLPDGVIVFVLQYVSPAWGGVSRLVKLDDAGAVQWDWVGRGRGGADTPFADVLRLTPAGTVDINGHIYVKKGDPARDWHGEVDATGALVRDELGGADPAGML